MTSNLKCIGEKFVIRVAGKGNVYFNSPNLKLKFVQESTGHPVYITVTSIAYKYVTYTFYILCVFITYAIYVYNFGNLLFRVFSYFMFFDFHYVSSFVAFLVATNSGGPRVVC